MATISEQLNTIETSVNDIRTVAGVGTEVAVDQVANVVRNQKEGLEAEVSTLNNTVAEKDATIASLNEQLANSSGAGESDIYLVKSIAERDALQVDEGKLCLVYENLSGPYTGGSLYEIKILEKLYIPVGAYDNIEITSADGMETLTFNVMADSDFGNVDIRYQNNNTGENFSTYYSSGGVVNGNLTFTINNSSSAKIKAGDIFDMTGGTISHQGYAQYAFLNYKITFEGIFKYNGNSWELIEAGLAALPESVLSGKFYSDTGVHEGALLELNTFEALKSKWNVINSINSSEALTSSNVAYLFQNDGNFNTLRFAQCLDVSGLNKISSMFSQFGYRSNIVIPEGFVYDLTSWDVSNIAYFVDTFSSFLYNNSSAASNFKRFDISNWNPTTVDSYCRMFSKANIGKEIDCSSLTSGTKETGVYIESMFSENTSVERILIPNITIVRNPQKIFYNCTALKYIDMRNFILDKDYGNMFTGVPADCEIIVKDDATKNIIVNAYSHLTNVKTVVEL